MKNSNSIQFEPYVFKKAREAAKHTQLSIASEIGVLLWLVILTTVL